MRVRLIVMLAVSLGACSRERGHAEARPAAPRNVLLITIDSLRADHVGAYGDADARTPSLDALAAGGVRFDRAYATAPLTLPSHASLLTGRYPQHHRARSDDKPIDAAVPTIAGAFRRAGFATAAFVSASALDRPSRLDTGFDAYDAGPPDDVDVRAARWLEAHKEPRFFVWVHLFAPHAPYGNPDDRARAARPALDRYDDDVTMADAQVGRLVSGLGPRRSQTLVVVTSDHGEAFGEHGEVTHGLFVYDTTLRVPLVFNGPATFSEGLRPSDSPTRSLAGTPYPAPFAWLTRAARSLPDSRQRRGLVVTDPVSLVDVAPTIAALAGLPRFESDGENLRNLPSSGLQPPASAARALYAETFGPLVDFGWSPLRAIRSGDWKYIAAPRPELYDLKTDPGETRNLVDDQPARAADLAREMERISPEPPAAAGQRQDPKDQREIAARLAEVTSGELRGPLLERALREIIRDDPGNGVANLRLAKLLAASNRCKEAVKRLKLAAAARSPGADGVILRSCSPQRR